MRLKPTLLVVLALVLASFIAVLWPGRPWLDPLAIALFLLAFVRTHSGLLYLAFVLSLLADILMGTPMGSTGTFYLPLTYLAIRMGRNMNIRNATALAAATLAAGAASLGCWLGLQLLLTYPSPFPFAYGALGSSALGVALLWKR